MNLPIKIGNEKDINNYANRLTEGEEQLLITRDTKKIFITDGKGSYDIISSLAELNEEKYYDKQNIDSLIKEFITKEEYIKDKKLPVKEAEKILGVNEADILSYYGKDLNGEVGFHYFPVESDKENNNIQQRVKLNVKKGESFTIDLNKQNKSNKLQVQIYKYKEGQNNIISTLKSFNNSDKNNFIYNENNVEFNNKLKIKDTYIINYNKLKNKEMFISDLINFEEYKDLLSIKTFQDNIDNEQLKTVIPDMTSATSPEGKCFCSSVHNGALYYDGWRAFSTTDKESHDQSSWATKNTEGYIGYEFIKPIIICAYSIKYTTEQCSSENTPKVWTFEGRNSYEEEWEVLHTVQNCTKDKWEDYEDKDKIFAFGNNKKFKMYRLNIKENNGGRYIQIKNINMYDTIDCNNKYIIKHNDKYYSINKESLDENKKCFKEVELDSIETTGFNSLEDLFNLIKSNYNSIEQFKKINIIKKSLKASSTNQYIIINGIKSKMEIIIANNDINTNLAKNIDYFKLIVDSVSKDNIKIIYSTDGGVNWYGKNQKLLSLNIPINKDYNKMTKEEKQALEDSKNIFNNKGLDCEELEKVDFNKVIKEEKIRFAYLINRQSYESKAEIDNLQWKFDSKGTMLIDRISDIELYEQTIKITPNENVSMLKINILT